MEAPLAPAPRTATFLSIIGGYLAAPFGDALIPLAGGFAPPRLPPYPLRRCRLFADPSIMAPPCLRPSAIRIHAEVDRQGQPRAGNDGAQGTRRRPADDERAESSTDQEADRARQRHLPSRAAGSSWRCGAPTVRRWRSAAARGAVRPLPRRSSRRRP